MNFVKTMMAASALALGASAVLAAPVTVMGIETSADYAGVEGANAATFWPKLADDLKERVGIALQPFQSDKGFVVDIKVQEVSLNGMAALSGAGEFNRLRGEITMRNDETNYLEKFTLDVNAAAEAPAYASPDAILIAPTNTDMYNSMVDAFAKAVADHVSRMSV